MIGNIDLHTHTTASDGKLTPTELVKYANRQGLSVVAITDHDTISGVSEGIEAGKKYGVTVVPGVELSVEGEIEGIDGKVKMHILGLGLDIYGQGIVPLLNELKTLRRERLKRVVKVVKLLRDHEVDIKFQDVLLEANGESVGKPHIAAAITKKGYTKDVDEACKTFLNKGCPAYVPRVKLAPQKAIDLINQAGGFASLAHPKKSEIEKNKAESEKREISNETVENIILGLKKIGLKGVEVYYSDHSKETTSYLINVARRNDLIETGGSDFHGEKEGPKPDIAIGRGYGDLAVPGSLFENIMGYYEKVKSKQQPIVDNYKALA